MSKVSKIYAREALKQIPSIDEILNELDIRTISHGSSDITKKGILVEEHNYGRLVFFDESGALFDYINRGKDGNVYQIHFSRLITQKSVINKIFNNRKW